MGSDEEGSGPISRVLSWATIPLGQHLRTGSSSLPACSTGRAMARLFGLAPDGVYPATSVAGSAVRSYRTFSPLPALARLGGIFSVALSVGSRLPAVSRRLALWSPDFPPRIAPQRSPGPLRGELYSFFRSCPSDRVASAILQCEGRGTLSRPVRERRREP